MILSAAVVEHAAMNAKEQHVHDAVSDLLDGPPPEQKPQSVVIRPPGFNFAAWLQSPIVKICVFSGSLVLFYFGLRWWFSSGGSSPVTSSGPSVSGASQYSEYQRRALELAQRVTSGANELDQVIAQAGKAMASK